MTIAIIGTGSVGRALGARLAGSGVPVVYGVRDPLKPRDGMPAVPIETVTSAVARAGIVVLAVPAASVVAAARDAGDLVGKIVIDCTNPVRFDGGPVWEPPAEGSMTAALAAACPGVAFVKGFNHFGAEIHADPRVAGGPADAYFAGDDTRAKQAAMALAERAGFRALDAGPLRNAAALEHLAVLWIQMAMTGAGRHVAFRLVGRV